MRKLDVETTAGCLHGTYDDAFEGIAEAFITNFRQHDEVGASVCVTLDGHTVVDLWGGSKDQDGAEPWSEDTICCVFSSTKGAVALAAHTLVGAGELELSAPVKKYWPEFAVNGKEDATVAMMFDHSVGVPALRETLPDGAYCDWDAMIKRIEQETPFWKPGTRNGYHMMNFGWTVGELVRRVSGESLGAYFHRAIAEPTEAEIWIGLPEVHEPKVAPMIPFVPPKGAPQNAFVRALLADRESLQSKALFNQGGFSPGKREYRAAEIGGGGALANGRGLARIYAPFACGGIWNDRTVVDSDTLSTMGEVAVATHEDATLLIPTRFGLGFMKSMDNRATHGTTQDSVILSSAAFGHVGAGGSIGFADPEKRMSFGYAMNRMGPGILMNERGQGLIDATYRALGCTSNASGVWR